MIQLKPEPYHKFNCPECRSERIRVKDLVFPGIHILADCICENCKTEFYHDFPIGHSLLYPEAISKSGKKYYTDRHQSFSKRFLSIFNHKNVDDISITKRNIKDAKDVILLNCIDDLYGHSLLKLLNAQYYLEKFPELDVVVLATKNFEWLIPEGVAETWLVDLPMSKTKQWLVKLDEFVKTEVNRFQTVWLSLAFSLPEPSGINIEKFTRTKRFELTGFDKSQFTVTFILREDRYWHQYSFEKFLWKAAMKLNLLDSLKWIFVLKQNSLFRRTIARIKKIIPEAKFNIVGLGVMGKFPDYVNDQRKEKVTDETELAWCRMYAESHLVIGVHGSNMLLPTALAGGFVEIFPSERFGNMLQDVLLPYSGRELQYFGRFVDEYIRPRDLAKIIAGIKENYRSFCVTMGNEYLAHAKYDDVSKWADTGK